MNPNNSYTRPTPRRVRGRTVQMLRTQVSNEDWIDTAEARMNRAIVRIIQPVYNQRPRNEPIRLGTRVSPVDLTELDEWWEHPTEPTENPDAETDTEDWVKPRARIHRCKTPEVW